jgi:hypothetical protein
MMPIINARKGDRTVGPPEQNSNSQVHEVVQTDDSQLF